MTTNHAVTGGHGPLDELKRLVNGVIDYLGSAEARHRAAERVAQFTAEERDAGLPPRISLRPQEAALVTGVSVATIKRALADGSLPSKRLRDMRLIRMADLNAWVDTLEDA